MGRMRWKEKGETLSSSYSLKSQGLIKKIGVSIYSPGKLDVVLKNFDIDLVQAPVNLFDHSMEKTGLGQNLKSRGIDSMLALFSYKAFC